uniref:G-protein coupled receptors family 1 profile domain-containing protein n=1 Tax=Spermophilus dauricus TaxID=99837 RepID=A0A8C9Q063_SPEDA
MENVTTVDEFLLLSLTSVQKLQPVFFVRFLIIYLINLLGNGVILMIVILDLKLHTPMYFFLGKVSCLDICYSFVTLPKVLMSLLSTCTAIFFLGCITQLHFFHFLGSTEAILLAVMAFDHFVAICNPLRYTVIMNMQLCVMLAAVTWFFSFFNALMHSVMTAHLDFCHSLKLNHFFCDVKLLLELACGNTELNQWLLSVVTGSTSMGTFFLTLLSYFCIIGFLVLKNKSCRILHKALSSCASHFMVVCLFYGHVGFTDILPASATSMSEDHTVAVIYSAVTPVLNPLIYNLGNKGVMLALKKIFGRKLFKDCIIRGLIRLISVLH